MYHTVLQYAKYYRHVVFQLSNARQIDSIVSPRKGEGVRRGRGAREDQSQVEEGSTGRQTVGPKHESRSDQGTVAVESNLFFACSLFTLLYFP